MCVALLPIVFFYLLRMQRLQNEQTNLRANLDEKRFEALGVSIEKGIKQAVTEAVEPYKAALREETGKWENIYEQMRSDSERNEKRAARKDEMAFKTAQETVAALTALGASVKDIKDRVATIEQRFNPKTNEPKQP